MTYQDDLRKLITKHKRRLQRRKEQKAQLGINTFPEILNEIEDIETEIEKLEAELKKIEARAEPVRQMDSSGSWDVRPPTQVQRPPFIPGGPVPPSYFVGRQDEVDEILDRLANPVRGSTAISGDPRAGKTSLLHYLREHQLREMQRSGPNGHHFLYLDCQGIVPFSERDFWRHILRELTSHLRDDENLSGRLQQLLAQTDPDSSDLNSLFDSIARSGRLVVLMLDEFEWVMENLDRNAPGLLYHLRALINRPERGLALLVATRKPLKQLCAGFNFHGSPFDNPFLIMTLRPFDEEDTNQLLNHYQANFFSEEQAYLRQIAGPHPYLIQLAASLIVQARNKSTTAELPFAQIEMDLTDEADRYFADMLNYSTELEKMLLAWLALAPLSQYLPAGKASLGELSRVFGYYDQELAQLIKRGLALREEDGLRLFSPVFNRWVLHKVVIAGGREVVSAWEPYYTNFLTLTQEEALKELVDKVIRRPGVTKTPHLLAQEEANPPAEPVRGKQLGRYIIEEPIGGGGMADVFKARDPDLNRLVAIKQMRAVLSNAEEFRARFLREAQAVATLRHSNIVQIYDFGLQDHHYYMVMEFIEGYNLRQYLDQLQEAGQSLPWAEGISIAAQVAQALDYAHQRGMLHRDVKPTNILLTNDGSVFLADFGLVRLLGQTELTQAGGVVGTLAYMAPEQIMGEKEEIDYRADIYALGCVVYEMITGRPLFESSSLLATHFDTNLPSSGLTVSTAPEAARQVILKALAINPAERPLSASQFIEELRQALNE